MNTIAKPLRQSNMSSPTPSRLRQGQAFLRSITKYHYASNYRAFGPRVSRAAYAVKIGEDSASANQQAQQQRTLLWGLGLGASSVALLSLITNHLRSSTNKASATAIVQEISKSKKVEQIIALSDKSTSPLSSLPSPQYNISLENIDAARRELVALLGQENVDSREGERVSHSSTEWSPAPGGSIPSMIVYPRSTEDVSNIAKICHRRRIPMIGFGGGTSLEGTLAAQHQEICIDFSRHMNRVLDVRKADMDVTVQPAVGYQELNEQLADQDMFFPPDPGPGAQIGGMVAQGCSGTNAYRYGTMKDWVLGLEVVLADGSIIKTRARPRKSSSGYDLTRLFTGSEGTLGFVTKIHLKATKPPANLCVGVAQFDKLQNAVKLAVKIVQSGHQLEAMELLDDVTMRAVNESGYCSTEWAEQPTLFMKFAGASKHEVDAAAKYVEEEAGKCESTLFRLAETVEESEELWEARKTALWSTIALKDSPDDRFLSADACVPISRVADIVERSKARVTKSGMLGAFVGHVGDGNVHTIVLYKPEQEAEARSIISDIQRMSVNMDGTVSGEHGIGIEFREQVVHELGQQTVDAMRTVKLALDPLCLLNPGKMIDMGTNPVATTEL